MNSNYKRDEKAIRHIINENVKTVNRNDNVHFVIYYKNKKTCNLVMKNNCREVRTLAKTSLVYEFKCPSGECIRNHMGKASYVGHTVCTLSRRLSMHLQDGSIKEHFSQIHGRKITRKEIVDNTIVRYFERCTSRLRILEALVIKFERPALNNQDTGTKRTLRLF